MDQLNREKRKYKLLHKKFPVKKQRDLDNYLQNPDTIPNEKKSEIVTTYDHFSSPAFDRQRSKLSEEEKRVFEKMGNNIYNTVDYESAKMYNPEDNVSEFIESLTDIRSALSSGLHPSRLTDEELRVLVKCMGEKWYEELGYKSSDLSGL